MLDTYTN